MTQVQCFLPESRWVHVPFTKRTAGPAFGSGVIQQGIIILCSLFSASVKVEKSHFQAVFRLGLLFLLVDFFTWHAQEVLLERVLKKENQLCGGHMCFLFQP